MIEQERPIGTLRPIVVSLRGREQRGHAYLPDPLPGRVDLEPATWEALADAAAALGELRGAVTEMPSLALVARPTIRREAVATSALEGTFALIDEVLDAEVADTEPGGPMREVLNYIRAVEVGLEAMKDDRPLSLNLIHSLHGVLMEGGRYSSGRPGRVRTSQVVIGSRTGGLEDAIHVPPPPGPDLEGGLHAWERWIHEARLHPLIRVGLGHYQFEVLHPYSDGNGRIGRLVVVLQLIEAGVLPDHLFAISPYLEERREAYLGELQAVTDSGDFNPWLTFFFGALAEAASDSQQLIRALGEAVEHLKEVAREAGLRGTAIRVVEGLSLIHV